MSKVINPNNLGPGLRVSFSTVTGNLTFQVVDRPEKEFTLSPEAALELRDLIDSLPLKDFAGYNYFALAV